MTIPSLAAKMRIDTLTKCIDSGQVFSQHQMMNIVRAFIGKNGF
jgi:hypothetical protein